MSEEFDKEAEREKLREKLEKDQQKRQETQRMSELLLQGATMTNEHCEHCGDPLFRDGERTFCPTCGGGERAAEQTDEQVPQQSSGQQPAEQRAPQPSDAEPTRRESERDNGAPTTDRVDVSRPDSASGASTADDPLAELQRAVTTTARKANEASDPRTAKAWLEASKEAAEALEALGE